MLLTPFEQRQVVAAVEQVGVLVASGRRGDESLHESARRRPLDDRSDHLVGDEAHRAERVQLTEVVAVARSADPWPPAACRTVLSPSNVVKTSLSALSWGSRFSERYPAPPQASRQAWMVAVACHVVTALMPAARVSSSRWARSSSEPVRAVVQRRDHLVLGEQQCVALRQGRQQPSLVGEVVEDDDLLVRARWPELTAPFAVANRDRQGQPGRRAGASGHADPALDQRAEHGEEPLVLVVDRAAVGAVGCDVAVAVEQCLARHSHVGEREPPVVDAAEPRLGSAVLDLDAGARVAVLVADRDEERVYAVRLPRR